MVPLLVCVTLVSLHAQSNHAEMLLAGGSWHLHARIPLGSDALLLHPGNELVEILASAEAPEFEGWSLQGREKRVVLLNRSGKPVDALPKTISFRVTAGTRDKLADANPMPMDCSKSLNDFLLDLHFQLQVFSGMQMREVKPSATSMIGVPADESSDERIYKVTFNLQDAKPDDRIVLLITNSEGTRLSKFHLEFL